MVHPWIKYPKCGHDCATDYTSRFVRYGMMIRDEAIDVVRKRDHDLDHKCVKDFCSFTGYSEAEFWDIADKFYDRDLFKKNEYVQWILKNRFGNRNRRKIMKEISLSIPNFAGNELKYVTEAIETGWVSTGGEFITKFENQVKEFVNCNYAIAVQSGTAAIHLALLACEVKNGEAVIVPSLTFVASVNPVTYVGAEPIFMDCDDSLCMDPVKVESFIKNECSFNGELIHKKTGRKISALIIVDVFGNCADKETFKKICSEFNIKMIEDAAESIGSTNESGQYMGTIGDVGIFSFNGNKIITTGGGGMIATNNKEIADKCRYLSTQAKDDTLYFVHNEIGYNYRMTNIQAAVGLAQFETLRSFIDIKKKNYEEYQKKLSKIGLELLPFRSNSNPNYWFYSLLVKSVRDRDDLIKWLSARNIQARPIWHVLHQLKPYKDCTSYAIDKAIYYWEHIVNIPCSTSLTSEDVDIVVNAIEEYYNENR